MNLRPEKRQNVNGHLVTKWVKDDNGTLQSESLRSAPSIEHRTIPDNIDWGHTSNRKAAKLATAVLDTLDDPDRLWQNLDFFTAMLESPDHSDAALELSGTDTQAGSGDGRALHSLRKTWQRMHGVERLGLMQCKHIEGDGGFEDFMSSEKMLTDAAKNAAERQRLAHNYSLVNPSFGDRLKKAGAAGRDVMNDVVNDAVGIAMIPFESSVIRKTPFGINPMLHGAQSYAELLEDAYPTKEKK